VRDLKEPVRQEVAEALSKAGSPDEWCRAVLELVPVTRAERIQQLGDDLPLGLKLVDSR
jgi:hypothetical protein